MRSKLCCLMIVGFFALGLTACKSTGTGSLPSASIGKVAVVSFAVNNYGAMYGQGAINPKLIEDSMGQLLTGTEEILSKHWAVKPAGSFVGSDAYYSLSIGKTRDGLFAPVFEGRSMPTFTNERNEVVKGILQEETARKLCQVLDVDAVVLFYSEWTLDSGKFIPTIKALTKNCVSMYNNKGEKLFYKRSDKRGEKVIGGAFAGVHINEDTIDNWIMASLDGIGEIFSSVK